MPNKKILPVDEDKTVFEDTLDKMDPEYSDEQDLDDSNPMDIDEARKKMGMSNDDNGVHDVEDADSTGETH